jgi:diaminohydroxyphosphoribosylaminopyrimidine deaminase/5-amino-6-(5-phosphoribosylamino)uracil reductase
MAVTMDGRVAAADGSSRWITGGASRRRAHQMRAMADCVMVGEGTVRRDDPRLTVRLQGPRDSQRPRRLVVAGPDGIPADSRMLREGPPAVVALPADAPPKVVSAMEETGAEVWRMPSENGMVVLEALLQRTAKEGMGEVLCEGGPCLATELLRRGLAARGAFFLAPKLLGSTGVPCLGDLGIAGIEGALEMENVRASLLEGDALLEGEFVHGTG